MTLLPNERISGFRPGSKLHLIVLFVWAFSLKSYSQSPGKDETVRRINELTGNKLQVEVAHDQITLRILDESGAVIRIDKAPLADLAEEAFVEKESGLVCVPCLKDAAGCVTRTLVVQKIKREYDRISLPVKDAATATSLSTALTHLIRLQTLTGYKDDVSF